MTAPLHPDATAPSELDIFEFDRLGYLIVRGALSPAEVAECNAVLDELQDLAIGAWAGRVHGHDYGGKEGLNLQQIYEAGPAFERFIDHPSWIERVRCFLGGEGTFDVAQGPCFIDENFASIRGPGEAIGLHSGGHQGTVRTQFRVQDRRFHCGQINVLTALTDIGPGDGATMVIPATHKANFPHPEFARSRMTGSKEAVRSVDGIPGAIEVHLAAGDSLIFVDALMHGSAARVNAGQRRIAVFRYGPAWGASRHGYQPSEELLARLNPNARKIIRPLDPLLPPVHA